MSIYEKPLVASGCLTCKYTNTGPYAYCKTCPAHQSWLWVTPSGGKICNSANALRLRWKTWKAENFDSQGSSSHFDKVSVERVVYMETDYLYGSQLFWLLCRCDSTLSEKQLKCCHCGRAHSKLTSMRALTRPQREMIASHKIFSQFFSYIFESGGFSKKIFCKIFWAMNPNLSGYKDPSIV